MRSTHLLALAAIVSLPLGGAALAAPAAMQAAGAMSKTEAPSMIIDVRKGGGGVSGGSFRMGSAGMRGGGGGPRFAAGGGGGPRVVGGGGGPRVAGFRGGPRGGVNYVPGRPGPWKPGGGGGGWKPGGGHHHHGHHHHYYPRWYGAPYYYGGYYPDAYYYDDYDDDAAVYADSGDAVARCAARYRSFDRASGTFLSNDGKRKLCPYLR
ncbi:BA14K family protein [Hyphomicrobium sp.]|uniref:BA14K family protein n=1 Tax=Hyphomicrobium sp. TaxID=82 RepID=UPI002E2F02E5|nr:BA14K family protein [Hyphomicrobium sp.]HEX2840569.1 BA14K family protein [Hyphomicrobium sp.]